ncbi:MAG TPA: hypothetical protein VEI52_22660 [Terriglobales bacterium]|nr:hypothetical protein [Terriglobales bacterium]
MVFGGIINESTLDRILMDVVSVMSVILRIPNAMIRESSLPYFAFAAENFAKGVRVSAFDELHGVLDGDVVGWGE